MAASRSSVFEKRTGRRRGPAPAGAVSRAGGTMFSSGLEVAGWPVIPGRPAGDLHGRPGGGGEARFVRAGFSVLPGSGGEGFPQALDVGAGALVHDARTRALPSPGRSAPHRPKGQAAYERATSVGLGERLPASTGAVHVGVVDRESGPHEALFVVEGSTRQVLSAGGVDDDLDPGELRLLVVGVELAVEEH